MANLEAAINGLVAKIDALNKRLDNVEGSLAGGAAAAPAAAGAAAGADSPSVNEFADLVSEHLSPFFALTDKIGGAELKSQVALLKELVEKQQGFLGVAAISKKPSASDLPKLLEPMSALIQKVIEIRDKNRANKQFNHLSALSEGVSFAGWVAVEPKPGPHVDEARASSQFYTNKILMEFKDKDADQVSWAKAWVAFLTELPKYIKKYHTTGLTWNPNGGNALSAAPAASKPAAGGPPPPPAGGPPPPPPPTGDLSAAPSGGAKGPDMGALFSQLNKGTAVTSGLRKVQDHEKTKNRKPEERSAVVPSSVGAKAKAAAPKAAAGKKMGTPKCALEGNKWVVEYQDGNKNVVIEPTATKEVVYIFGCKNSLINIKTKVNAITLDGCDRTALVFTDCVASVDLVNCKSAEVQVVGRVPTVVIDKCSGVQLVLSKECLDCEVVTSKSDQMNVLIPGGDDLVEMPIPEQYKTIIKDNKLVTQCMEHSG